MTDDAGLRIEIVRSPEDDNADECLAAYRWHAFVPGRRSRSEGEGIFVVDRCNGGRGPRSDDDEVQLARITALVVLGNELRDRDDGDLPERIEWDPTRAATVRDVSASRFCAAGKPWASEASRLDGGNAGRTGSGPQGG